MILHHSSSHKKASEQIKPNEKEEVTELEEAVDDVEGVKQGNVAANNAATNFMNEIDSEEESLNETELELLAETVEPVLIASSHPHQSATNTALDLLNESEEQSSLGVKAETVELNLQSAAHVLDASEELTFKPRLSSGEAWSAEPLLITSPPSDNQSAKDTSLDVLDESEQLPLTLQQREAISRRHPLKFITGHYGSGKVRLLLSVDRGY